MPTVRRGSAITPITQAYLDYYPALRRYARRYLYGTGVQHEDILQQAFLKAYEVELQRPIEQPKSFLFKIVRNEALDSGVFHRRYEVYDSENELHVQDRMSYSSEEEVTALDQIEHQLAAINTLPSRCREVYLLRNVQGLSQREVADKLGIVINTVDQHTSKATRLLESLRQQNEAYVDERRRNRSCATHCEEAAPLSEAR